MSYQVGDKLIDIFNNNLVIVVLADIGSEKEYLVYELPFKDAELPRESGYWIAKSKLIKASEQTHPEYFL